MKKTYRLSDLDIDEVSFVEQGANQRARVVLWKSYGSGESDGSSNIDPDQYDRQYGTVTNRQIEDARNQEYDLYPGVSKDVWLADVVKSVDLDQLLGEVQCRAAQQRESALFNTTVSLYRRLGLDSGDLADEYDRTYGRPVDEDARTGRS
jgi:hypothetical protein